MHCKKCGGDIYSGDKYLQDRGGAICEECLEEFTIYEWLELFEEKLLTAI